MIELALADGRLAVTMTPECSPDLRDLERLHGHPPRALMRWPWLVPRLRDRRVLYADEATQEALARVVEEARREAAPFYDLDPITRLLDVSEAQAQDGGRVAIHTSVRPWEHETSDAEGNDVLRCGRGAAIEATMPDGEVVTWLEQAADAAARVRLSSLEPLDGSPTMEEAHGAAIQRASDAIRAIELERKFNLYGWQRDDLARLCCVGSGVVGWAPGGGKAQPLTAQVLTPSGFRAMGDLVVGDCVIGGDGQPTRVTGVFPQGEKDVFRVTLRGGASTECCDEHLWKVATKSVVYRKRHGLRPGTGKVLPLAVIRAGLFDKWNIARHFVPTMAAPARFDSLPLPMNPYLLGVILGDGGISNTSVGITKNDEWLHEQIALLCPDGCRLRRESNQTFIVGARHGSNPCMTILRALGLQGHLSKEKFIPDVYKVASPEDRLAVIHGLLDTDGSAEGSGVEYSSASKRLADDMLFMVKSLGGIGQVHEKRTTWTYKGKHNVGKAWRLVVTLPVGTAPFRMPRKLDAWTPREKYTFSHRAIVSVEAAGRKQCQCISVAAADGLYVTDEFIVTHNTICACMAARALADLGKMPPLALFVVPQDLIGQWQGEARRRFGRHLVRIDSPQGVADEVKRAQRGLRHWAQRLPLTPREAAQQIRAGRRDWFVTHFECLSRSGRVEVRDKNNEWVLRVKPGYTHLLKAFKAGMIVVDEGTRVKGDDTDVGLAIRSLHARHRIILTGTPIRNRLPDVFWLLWWVGGNLSSRFPYSYQDGPDALAHDFGVVDVVDVDGKKRRRRRAEACNVPTIRRLLAPLVLRRSAADVFGQTRVKTEVRAEFAPWGTRQREQYASWLDADLFRAWWQERAARLEQERVAAAAAAAAKAASEDGGDGVDEETLGPTPSTHSDAVTVALAQLSHLEYATTCPLGDPEQAFAPPAGASNWTPKALRVLDVTLDAVRRGQRVLVGSGTLAFAYWIAEQLKRAGIDTVSLVQKREGGGYGSVGPRERDAQLKSMRAGHGSALVAGVQALALGHNLDFITTAVLSGLPWDLATYEQFLARPRRLSSEGPVTLHVVMTSGSLDERKWELLAQKRDAAARALDGGEGEASTDEQTVSVEQVLRDLQQRGLPVADRRMDERQCEANWHAKVAGVKHEIESLTRGRAVIGDTTDSDLEFAAVQHAAEKLDRMFGSAVPEDERWHPTEQQANAIGELAAALTSGYEVIAWTGHRALLEPATDVYVAAQDERAIVRGSAYDCAEAVVRAVGIVEANRAIRMCRMPPDYREAVLHWWTTGPLEWEIDRIDWWREGAYEWETRAA